MAGFRKRGYVKAASLDPAEIEAISRRSALIPRMERPFQGRWRSKLAKLLDGAPLEPIMLTGTGPDWPDGAHAQQGDFDLEVQTHPPKRRPSLIERALGQDVMMQHGWRSI